MLVNRLLLIVYWEKDGLLLRAKRVLHVISDISSKRGMVKHLEFVIPVELFIQKPSNPYQHQINQMIENELESAYRIIFMVDFNFPNHPDDITIRQHLKRYSKKTLLVINKADNFERLDDIHPFMRMALMRCILYPLFKILVLVICLILWLLIWGNWNERQMMENNIAIIGKPNAGKSSLYNGLFNKEKAIVDARMGTTRDINESLLKVSGRLLNFMDTAGLRRRRKVSDTIEYFSIIRTERAIEDADIVIYMIDAEELLTDQDKKLLNDIFKQGKNCIVFVNKWDLLSRNTNTRNDIIKF